MANPPLTDLASFAGEHLYYEAQMFVTAREKLFQFDQLRKQQLPVDTLSRQSRNVLFPAK